MLELQSFRRKMVGKRFVGKVGRRGTLSDTKSTLTGEFSRQKLIKIHAPVHVSRKKRSLIFEHRPLARFVVRERLYSTDSQLHIHPFAYTHLFADCWFFPIQSTQINSFHDFSRRKGTQLLFHSFRMATGSNDEKQLKECFQSIIDAVSAANNQLEGGNTSPQLLNDLRNEIRTVANKLFPSLSTQCRNFLVRTLGEYHYSPKDKTLSDSFTHDMLESFLEELQGRLSSLDVFQAAWNGDQEVVENFAQNYPDLVGKSSLYETTLLYSAARNNHLDLVKYLVEEAECSVNVQNEACVPADGTASTAKAIIGSTPLHAACFQGHLDVVTYLVAHGGDYYMLNNANETPVQNGKKKSNIQQFFEEFLVFGYTVNLSSLPTRKILQTTKTDIDLTTDCIWEYKPIALEQWISFPSDVSAQLQKSLLQEPLETEIRLQSGRDLVRISLAKLLRSGPNPKRPDNLAWIRCRGSSLLNFRCYGRWQLMFIRHPTGTINLSPSIEVLEMSSDNNVQFNSWYNVDDQINLILETAMNYRRRYITISVDILYDEQVTLNLESFSFANAQNTIEGFLRWIPKFISDATDLSPVDNFELSDDSSLMLLTTMRVKQAELDEVITSDESRYHYDLLYETAFQNDDLDHVNMVTTPIFSPSSLFFILACSTWK